jgi:hypothetical protein
LATPERAATASTVTAPAPLARSSAKVASAMRSSVFRRGAINSYFLRGE